MASCLWDEILLRLRDTDKNNGRQNVHQLPVKVYVHYVRTSGPDAFGGNELHRSLDIAKNNVGNSVPNYLWGYISSYHLKRWCISNALPLS